MNTLGIRVIVVLTLLLAAMGCRSAKNDPSGLILVGTPEVSTRERLVNDRLTQDHWLREQLKASDNVFDDFQGLLDERALTALSINASINADSNQLALYDAKSASSLQSLKQSNELSALDHQIEILKKKKQLAELQQGTGTATAPGNGGIATEADTPETPPGADTGTADSGQTAADPARPSSPASGSGRRPTEKTREHGARKTSRSERSHHNEGKSESYRGTPRSSRLSRRDPQRNSGEPAR